MPTRNRDPRGHGQPDEMQSPQYSTLDAKPKRENNLASLEMKMYLNQAIGLNYQYGIDKEQQDRLLSRKYQQPVQRQKPQRNLKSFNVKTKPVKASSIKFKENEFQPPRVATQLPIISQSLNISSRKISPPVHEVTGASANPLEQMRYSTTSSILQEISEKMTPRTTIKQNTKY